MTTFEVILNCLDKDELLEVERLSCNTTEARWLGARATHGIKRGKYYFEAAIIGTGQCRFGWSSIASHLQLGKDAQGFGYISSGGKYTNNSEKEYGCKLENNSVVGCYLNREDYTIHFSLNGVQQGPCFDIPSNLSSTALFPAVAMKSAGGAVFNFGNIDFKYPPLEGFKGLCAAGVDDIVAWSPADAVPIARPQGQSQKQQGKSGGGKGKGKGKPDQAPESEKSAISVVVAGSERQKNDSISRFRQCDHLLRRTDPVNTSIIDGNLSLHLATLKLGDFLRTGTIRDDDDRVVSALEALHDLIADYTSPSKVFDVSNFEIYIKLQIEHWNNIRPHCTSVLALIKQVLTIFPHLSTEVTEEAAKADATQTLKRFLNERILAARTRIIEICDEMIHEGDVVLTFGSSPLLRQILLAVAARKRFSVVVVDSRPQLEGVATLSALSPRLACVYCSLTGAPAMMRSVTRVILGASSLLSNGAVLAPAGTAMVAAVAKAAGVPVWVVAESMKASDVEQVDAIVSNELGSAEEVVMISTMLAGAAGANASTSSVAGGGAGVKTGGASAGAVAAVKLGSAVGGSWSGDKADRPTHVIAQTKLRYRGPLAIRGQSSGTLAEAADKERVQVINLRYDLTPSRNIDIVVTEFGSAPPASIGLSTA